MFHRFIGERAERYLKGLTEIGPRVVGSYANEHLAVTYLTQTVQEIIKDSNDVHKYEIDVQKPVGSYYLDYKPWGIRNYYANIQNVVVRISPKTSNSSGDGVLVNCHYDTVNESPGESHSVDVTMCQSAVQASRL